MTWRRSTKALTSNYLGLKDHKLYSQVEEGFHAAGACLSPAELGEIMLANRASPSRALRSVITKLQHVCSFRTLAIIFSLIIIC
jgi:hypothetical protein